jgi:hypothetical protein
MAVAISKIDRDTWLRSVFPDQMKCKLVIWKVGGKFAYPDAQDIGKDVSPRDCGGFFTDAPNIPFPSFL